MDDDPAPGRPPQEGLVARARRRGGARRQGLGHGQRRQHRRHHGQRAAAHGPHQGRVAARPSPRRSRCPGSTPTVLLDAGANAECQPEWLVQFAQMGAVFAAERYGIAAAPGRPAVDRRGGDQGQRRWSRRPTRLLAERRRRASRFVGNVEGRDLMTDDVDVVVTDGFTGNVALKTLEGGMRRLVGALLEAFASPPRPARPSEALLPALLPARTPTLDPETTGGAMLLGVDGVCIISHGSSSATAMVNAVRVAQEMVEADVVGHSAASAPADRHSLSRRRRAAVHGVTDSRPPRYARTPDCRYPPERCTQEEHPCPPRPTSSRAAWTARQVFELIRDRLADILEIEPSDDHRGRLVRRRPRGRLAGPDRAGRGARGGAGRAHRRLPHRRRGPRGPEDRARRRRLRRRPSWARALLT